MRPGLIARERLRGDVGYVVALDRASMRPGLIARERPLLATTELPNRPDRFNEARADCPGKTPMIPKSTSRLLQ